MESKHVSELAQISKNVYDYDKSDYTELSGWKIFYEANQAPKNEDGSDNPNIESGFAAAAYYRVNKNGEPIDEEYYKKLKESYMKAQKRKLKKDQEGEK